MKKVIGILMMLAILLGAIGCGSGIDNGVSSQQATGTQSGNQGGGHAKDPGPQQR